MRFFIFSLIFIGTQIFAPLSKAQSNKSEDTGFSSDYSELVARSHEEVIYFTLAKKEFELDWEKQNIAQLKTALAGAKEEADRNYYILIPIALGSASALISYGFCKQLFNGPYTLSKLAFGAGATLTLGQSYRFILSEAEKTELEELLKKAEANLKLKETALNLAKNALGERSDLSYLTTEESMRFNLVRESYKILLKQQVIKQIQDALYHEDLRIGQEVIVNVSIIAMSIIAEWKLSGAKTLKPFIKGLKVGAVGSVGLQILQSASEIEELKKILSLASVELSAQQQQLRETEIALGFRTIQPIEK